MDDHHDHNHNLSLNHDLKPQPQSHAPSAFIQDTPPRADVDEILRRKRKAREYKVSVVGVVVHAPSYIAKEETWTWTRGRGGQRDRKRGKEEKRAKSGYKTRRMRHVTKLACTVFGLTPSAGLLPVSPAQSQV
jgi:hypothetical protein